MCSLQDGALLVSDVDKLSRVLADSKNECSLETRASPPVLRPANEAPCVTGTVPLPEANSHQVASPAVSSFSGYLSMDNVEEQFDDDIMLSQQEIPTNLENCITLNKAYQEVIDESLAELSLLLDDLRRRKQLLESEMAVIGSCSSHQSTTPTMTHSSDTASILSSRGVGWSVFMHRFFRGYCKFGPALPADAHIKRASRQYMDLRVSRFWNQSDHELLYEAVVSRQRQHRLNLIAAKQTLLDEKQRVERAKQSPDPLLLASFDQLRVELQQEESAVHVMTEQQLMGPPDHPHDWLSIARSKFDGVREAEDCERQWRNWVHPSIKHDEWTSTEDEAVVSAVKMADVSESPWKLASRQLKGSRTPLQVFQRWAVVLCEEEQNIRYWSVGETRHLLSVIGKVRHETFISWSDVAFHLFDRSPAQCRRRYMCLNPVLLHGPFTPDEDLVLVAGVDGLQLGFGAVASVLKQRTAQQLRRRYRGRLAASVNLRDWRRSEEQRLVQLVWRHGANWTLVSQQLGTSRTGVDCLRRFCRIQRKYRSTGKLPSKGPLTGWDPSNRTLERVRRVRSEALAAISSLQKHDKTGTKDKRALLRAYCMKLVRRQRARNKQKLEDLQFSNDGGSFTDYGIDGAVGSKRRGNDRRYQPTVDLVPCSQGGVKLGVPKWRRELGSLALSIGRLMLARATCIKGLPYADAVCHQAQVCCTAWGLNAHVLRAVQSRPATNTTTPQNLALLDSLIKSAECDNSQELGSNTHETSRDGHVFRRPALQWQQYPLLPPARATVAMFRSLLHLRGHLEQCVVGDNQRQPPHLQLKQRELSWALARWASRAMQTPGRRVPGPASWLQPRGHARHRDNVAQVNVFYTEPAVEGCAESRASARVMPLLLPISDTLDRRELLRTLCKRVPHVSKVTVSLSPHVQADDSRSQATPSSASPDDVRVPNHCTVQEPRPDGDQLAWNQLVSRFVSLFLWPALTSFNQLALSTPPSSSSSPTTNPPSTYSPRYYSTSHSPTNDAHIRSSMVDGDFLQNSLLMQPSAERSAPVTFHQLKKRAETSHKRKMPDLVKIGDKRRCHR